MTPRRIVVVGGGISGLTALYHLAEARRAGAPVEEYLVESSSRLGGALHTERLEGCLVEAGADSFLTEKPEAAELCRQLGLGEQLIGSQDVRRRTLILHRGELVPLPEGFEFLAPTRYWAVARTPLLSFRDKLTLATEGFRRFSPPSGDESVAQFVERHFGRGLVENIVDPLLSAVYGSDADRLSAAATLPRLRELERKYGSLSRGMRRALSERRGQSAGRARPPLFTTLRDGLGTLVEALRHRLEGKRVLVGRRVVAVEHSAGSGYRVRVEGQEPLDADAVMPALPAHEAANLLRPVDGKLAKLLGEISYSSSLIVALTYRADAAGQFPAGFGFLVPRKAKRRLLACTFVGQKFPHRVPPERVLLRCFLGGVHDESVLALNDEEIVHLARRELREILKVDPEPVASKVYRWRKALPQYTVGHLDRVEAIRALRGNHPGLFLCGNAYQGIGVPDCIRSGRGAAEQFLAALRTG